MVKVDFLGNDAEEWNSYVTRQADTTFFHQVEWKHVIEKTYKHQPFYLIERVDGNIEGILPLFLMKHMLFGKFLVSIPFGDYGGICTQQNDIAEALLLNAVEIAKQQHVKYLELKQLRMLEHESLLLKTSRVGLVLNLEKDPEKIWNTFKSEIRNRIRKAENNGLKVQFGKTEILNIFYPLYARGMRDMGTPVHSRSFFNNILDEFPDHSSIILVEHGEQVIGGAIATYFKDIMEIPWVVFLHQFKKICPSNLLYWKAIEKGCLKGYQFFNFGRSPFGSGAYEFKKRWGAKPFQLYYQYYIPKGGKIPDYTPSTNSSFDMAVRIWQKMPIGLTKIIGPRIIAGIPY